MVSSRAVRRRLASLADVRRLTDAEADTLLEDEKTINESVVWTVSRSRSGRPSEVRAKVTVFNSLGQRLSLTGRIPLSVPQTSHWALIWGQKTHKEYPESIRRLDLRDDHDNPDGEQWRGQTHKHRWSVASGNDWAYTPVDIPHEESPVGREDYRAIFEAFARECRIGFGPEYKWTDPDLAPEPPTEGPMLWEVP